MPLVPSAESLMTALAAIPWFASLDEERRRQLAECAQCREFSSGDAVFRQGDDLDGLFVIVDGWFKVVKGSADGREQTLRVLGPGEVFNTLNLFLESPNPATVVALESAVAWEIPGSVMVGLLSEEPRLAWGIIQLLADRLQHLTDLVADLSLRTVEARLARLLLEQAQDGVLDRRRWATQAEMAARIGTVPDVINRALRNMERSQLIQVKARQIRILDPARLSQTAKPD